MKKTTLMTLSVFSFITVFSGISLSKPISINNNTLYSEKKVKAEAEIYFKKKNYIKSEFLFGKLLKKHPENGYYRIKYAFSLMKLERFEEAEEQFKYLSENSTNPELVEYSKKILKDLKNLNKLTKTINKIKKQNEIETIKDDPSKHYLCNKLDSGIIDGYIYRWNENEMPIKIYVSSPAKSLKNLKDPDKYITLFKKGVSKWTSVANFLNVYYVYDADSANVTVDWVEFFESDSAWGKALLPHFKSESSSKKTSNMKLPVMAQPGSAETTDNAVYFSESEFVNIVTHEFGHVLGLTHSFKSSVNTDIMRPFAFRVAPDFEATISQRDINTLKLLYSMSEDKKYKCS